MAIDWKPDGYGNITPYLVVNGAEQLLEFLQKGLGAEFFYRMDGPDGSLAHAEVKVGDSMLMLGSAEGSAGGEAMPSTLYLYVPDTDASYKQALSAGATSVEEPNDAFYGDRRAAVRDPVGNMWFFATRQEEVSEEEMAKRAAAGAQG